MGADRHEPAQRPGIGGRQQLHHLRHAAPRRQRAVVVGALARVRVAQRHLADADAAAAATMLPLLLLLQLPGEVVRHEAAVAGAHHVHGPAAAEAREVLAREERGERGGLEGVGPRGRARGGRAEEEQRRHHQVEVPRQGSRLRRPLPRRVRSEAVDQHHHRRRPLVGVGVGGRWLEEGRVGPVVDGGVGGGVHGGGALAEAGRGEHPPEHRVEQGHHAETHCSLPGRLDLTCLGLCPR